MILAPRYLPRLAATVGLFTRYGLRDFAQQQGLIDLAPEEAAAVKRAAQEFPLEIVFRAETGGDDRMLSGLPVVIRDAQGNAIFEGVSRGPYFLAELPPGDYVVETRWRDWTFSAPVTVGGDEERDRIVFSWRPVESLVAAQARIVRPAEGGSA